MIFDRTEEYYEAGYFQLEDHIYCYYIDDKKYSTNVVCDVCDDGSIELKGYHYPCPICHGRGKLLTYKQPSVLKAEVEDVGTIKSIIQYRDKKKIGEVYYTCTSCTGRVIHKESADRVGRIYSTDKEALQKKADKYNKSHGIVTDGDTP